MTPQDIIAFKLQPALEECAMHRQRLHQAWLEASESALSLHWIRSVRRSI